MGSGAYRVVVGPAHSAAPLEKGMGLGRFRETVVLN